MLHSVTQCYIVLHSVTQCVTLLHTVTYRCTLLRLTSIRTQTYKIRPMRKQAHNSGRLRGLLSHWSNPNSGGSTGIKATGFSERSVINLRSRITTLPERMKRSIAYITPALTDLEERTYRIRDLVRRYMNARFPSPRPLDHVYTRTTIYRDPYDTVDDGDEYLYEYLYVYFCGTY